MAKKKGGKLSQNPYNEAGSMADVPDSPDSEMYVDYSQVMANHLSTDGGDMESTPNSRSGEGIMGGPASGEPNPVGMSIANKSK